MEVKKEKATKEKLKYLNVDTWSIWECEPSSFDWEYFENERCYILEGEAFIEFPDKSRIKIKEGDLVLFPKGLKCHWQVIKKIRKRYRFE